MTDNFSEMPRATLEEHARAYANGMHQLAKEVMHERIQEQKRSEMKEVFNMLWGTDYNLAGSAETGERCLQVDVAVPLDIPAGDEINPAPAKKCGWNCDEYARRGSRYCSDLCLEAADEWRNRT